jgi:dihydropyrimidine dehydrogenase (NAD+) subunit PreA
MVDLSIEIAGVRFRNPIWTASMTFGWSGKALRRAGEAGAGAVVPKSIGSPEATFQHPRCGRMKLFRHNGVPIGMQNNEIFSTLPLDEWLDTELSVAAKGGAKLVVSIVANEDPERTARIAQKVAATGLASLLELNISCPMPARGVGMNIGKHPDLAADQVRAVKAACPDLPLMPKLTPNVSDVAEIACACAAAGADAIAATNSVQALVGVDIETGEPLLPAFGGYSGPAVRPIMLRCVAQIAQAVDIPVCGIGGVGSWEHAVEMMMVGAGAVQLGTAVLWHGYDVITRTVQGLENFMERRGFQRPSDFVGMALPHMTTTEEMATRPAMAAFLDQSACIACGRCLTVCGYDAISLSESGTYATIPRACDGCGLCIEVCPAGAIQLKPIES